MNEVVLKLLALGTIGLVVVSALWLAGSVKSTHHSTPYRLAQTSPSVHAGGVQVSALPVERAASSAFSRIVGVR